MHSRPWIIWTIAVVLLVTLVGLALMFYAVFHHSGTEHLFEMGVWITVVPVFLLLALAKLKLGGIAGGENEEWASRRTRLVIWSIVALLVIVAVLLIVWVLRLEGAESTLR